MPASEKERQAPRFSLDRHLQDPLVLQGFEDQNVVLEAAALVRTMREKSGMSQEALATKLGTSQAHLSMLERGIGRNGPTFLMLNRIAKACGQTLHISARSVVETKPRKHLPASVAASAGSTRFRPLHDRLVVRPIASQKKTRGGIIIPDTARAKPMEGEVLAVGIGTRDDSGEIKMLDVKVGDRILFDKWSGSEVRLEGSDLLILRESDVIGVVDGDSTSEYESEIKAA